MEPTVAELGGFVSIGDVATWAQVTEPNLALLEASFGTVRTDGYRGLGAATELEFNTQLDTIRDAGGAGLSFMAKHTLRLLGRACRLATGAEPTRAVAAAAAAYLVTVRNSKTADSAPTPRLIYYNKRVPSNRLKY